ncbi:MAG: DUF502 domain-containing protein [Methyloceanibacter sp.]|nr:DUF502 domain-containing protein [Methyloceanibacter sp.]
MGRIFRVFLSGALVLLPIMVTVLVTVWLGSMVATYAGPGSFLGNLITSLGLPLNLSGSSHVAYFIGLGIILALIFLLGLAVESGLRNWISNSFDWFMTRIPLVSNVYDISKRFVAIMDRSGEEDSLKSMSPVWCFFGGEGSAGVLALMPSHEPVSIGETSYVPVLVPFAPVPFGGALIYVPQDWVRPAEGGVEKLVNVYVSMGVTPPKGLPPGGVPAGMFPTGAIPAVGFPAGGSALVSEAADISAATAATESASTSAEKPASQEPTPKKPAPRKHARKAAAKAASVPDGEPG